MKKVRKVIQPLATKTETHEPAIPRDWPNGHVNVKLTGDEVDECVKVTIHGIDHYLHATTARELSNMLLGTLEKYNSKVRLENFHHGGNIQEV